MGDLYTQIDKLTKAVEELALKSKSETEQIVEEEVDFSFNKKQWINFATRCGIIAVAFFTQLIINQMNSPFWGISLGLFIGFMTEAIVFIYDWIFIPGDTLRNAKNHSTYIIIVAASVWMGVIIGNNYVPNVLDGEAADRNAKYENVQPANPYRLDDETRGDDGTPNR